MTNYSSEIQTDLLSTPMQHFTLVSFFFSFNKKRNHTKHSYMPQNIDILKQNKKCKTHKLLGYFIQAYDKVVVMSQNHNNGYLFLY